MNLKKILSLLSLSFIVSASYCSTYRPYSNANQKQISPEQKEFLFKLAKEASENKKYETYKEIKSQMEDNLNIFEAACNKSSAQPNGNDNNSSTQSNGNEDTLVEKQESNACNLFNQYTKTKNYFDIEFEKTKKAAAESPQAKTYEQCTGEKFIK